MTHTPETIDALILAAATDAWVKTAVMISKIFDDPALGNIDKDKRGQVIAERLYILIDNGALEGRGNMRRWRDSDVRLQPSLKPGGS